MVSKGELSRKDVWNLSFRFLGFTVILSFFGHTYFGSHSELLKIDFTYLALLSFKDGQTGSRHIQSKDMVYFIPYVFLKCRYVIITLPTVHHGAENTIREYKHTVIVNQWVCNNVIAVLFSTWTAYLLSSKVCHRYWSIAFTLLYVSPQILSLAYRFYIFMQMSKFWETEAGIILTLWVCECVIHARYAPGDTFCGKNYLKDCLSTFAIFYVVCRLCQDVTTAQNWVTNFGWSNWNYKPVLWDYSGI